MRIRASLSSFYAIKRNCYPNLDPLCGSSRDLVPGARQSGPVGVKRARSSSLLPLPCRCAFASAVSPLAVDAASRPFCPSVGYFQWSGVESHHIHLGTLTARSRGVTQVPQVGDAGPNPNQKQELTLANLLDVCQVIVTCRVWLLCLPKVLCGCFVWHRNKGRMEVHRRSDVHFRLCSRGSLRTLSNSLPFRTA